MSQRAAAMASAPAKAAPARPAPAGAQERRPRVVPERAAGGPVDSLDGAHAVAPGTSCPGFAGLPPGSVVDADVERRLATQRLLEQLAPMLGLDARRIRVEIHAAGRARLDAAGAQGLQEGATIWLHPAHYRPRHEAGRYLLAHEATHAAQRLLHGPADEPRAEAEAHELGREFAAGRAPRRPRVALAGARAAADAGARPGLLAATRDAQPIDVDTVRVSRSRELAAIRDALSGVWVSDGDVFDVLEVLDSVPYAVIHPLLMALSEQERYWLADNINPPHIYRNRKSTLACYYQTLDTRRLRDAVDLKVLRALPPGGLVTEEIEAAAWVLQHLSADQQDELQRSTNGLVIKRLMQAPQPSDDETERLRREATQAARDESALFKQRQAVAAMAKDDAAKGLLDKVRALLVPDSVDDRRRPSQARDALDLLAEADRGDKARLTYVAEQMEAAGLVDVLLQMLPSQDYFDTPAHAQTLTDLVAARLPQKNEKLVEDLLSYGLFDWAIRDYEALFAYKLIALLPLADQYKFRLRDGGKWYVRLLDNLPDDPQTHRRLPGIEVRKAESSAELQRMRDAGATAASDKTLLFNASQVYEKKLAQSGTGEVLANLVAAFEKADKGGIGSTEAKELYCRLVVVGASSLTVGHEAAADDILLATVVHELDRAGWMEKLFSALSDDFLYSEATRFGTVKLMLARDPARVQVHARDLVSRGIAHWVVTSRDAWLAYQCLKALPADERNLFVAEKPELWARVREEMSASMRESRDTNLYVGDRLGVDRANVLGQLALPATWSADNAALLGDLVRMAIAMTEHRFAFDRSREFDAIGQPALAPLVEKFRLWDPQRRPKYAPDLLEGLPWYREGPLQTLHALWGGIATLATADFLFVDRKVGVRLDLGHAQDALGGDLMGAKLADPAARGATKAPTNPEANKLTLLIGTDGRSAELILPQLELESANLQFGAATMESGRVSLKGLRVHASYDSESLLQPARAEAKIDALEANDLLLAKSASMVTATRLVVGALRLAAGAMDTVSPGFRQGSEKSVPVPLLVVPLLPLLVMLALPVLLYRKIASAVSSLKNQGLEDPGRFFADDIASSTKALSFTLGSLDVDSLTTSGGEHVGRASVRDFSVRVGLDKATRLEAESRSLGQRIGALQGVPGAATALAALNERRAKVLAEKSAIDADEIEYLGIMKELRGGQVTPERQKTLQQRLDALKFDDAASAFIDVGAVDVSGLSGTVTAKEPIRLGNIHGEGGGSSLAQFIALPTVTENELDRRSAAGARPRGSLAGGQDGHFVLDVGDIHTGALEVGGGLRSVADIDRQLAELEPQRTARQVRPLYDALQALRVKAARHELMVQHGLSQLDAAQLAEFHQLRTDLAAQADLLVQSIDAVHAKLDADVATGRVGFSAESVRATGVDAPARGLHVDQIVARGLGVSALPRGGLLGLADLKKNLQGVDGHVDSLEIDHAQSRFQGLLFEKATLTGAYASLKDRGDDVELGLKQFAVDNVGIAPRIGLMQQRLQGLREQMRGAEPDARGKIAKEIADLSAAITDLQALVDARTAAARQLDAARTPAEIEAAKQAVANADASIVLGLAQYGATHVELDQFGVRATGAGDVVSQALTGHVDALAALGNGGVRVSGTGADHQLFKRFAVRGAQGSQTPQGQAPLRSASAGEFDVGPTRLDVSARRTGDSIDIDVPAFSIASIELDGFDLSSSGGGSDVQMWSTGRSGLDGILFKGAVRLESRVPGSQDLADFGLAHVHVDVARIDRIHGAGLGVALFGERKQVTIASGSIGGVHLDQFDVDWPADPNAAPAFKGRAGIDSIDKLVVGESFAKGWRVNGGRIDARSIGAEFLEDGGVKASVGSLSLSSVGVRGPDGWVRFTLADLGGKFGYDKGNLTVDDLHFGRLEVDALHWKVGTAGYVESELPTTISDVSVKGRIETRPDAPSAARPGGGAGAGRKLSRVVVDRLHVGKVESRHLVYQDEDSRVELGEADPIGGRYRVGFKPLFLRNLDVWGLDWSPVGGIGKGNATLGEYEASARFDGLKTALSAGIALRGKGMSVDVAGPGALDADLGKIDKVGGELHNANIDTRLAAANIVGKISLGPDFVEAKDVAIGRTLLSGMRYRDLPNVLTLDAVNIDRIALGSVRQNYAVSTDPATKGEKTPTTLEVRDLEVFGVMAREFDYKGESRGKVGTGADAKDEVATQHVKGRSATISHLKVGSFEHDALARRSRLDNASVDAVGAKQGTRPFGIQGLGAELVDTIGSETTKQSLLTDIEGGPLTAQKIEFATVVLGTHTGPDGRPVDVTRSSITGGFELTRLGFVNPDLTLTDAKGRTTAIGGYGSTITIAGLKPVFMPNGTVALPVDSIIAKDLGVKRGDMTIRLPLLEIRSIALGLRGMGTAKGMDFLAARIGSIHFQDASIELVSAHKADLTDDEYAAALKDFKDGQQAQAGHPAGKLIAEPLSGLQGHATGEYELDDLPNPGIRPTIRNGYLDFAGMTSFSVQLRTEDVTRDGRTGPEDKVELGSFPPRKTLKDFKRKMPGFYGGNVIGGSGGIDIRETVEGLANEPASAPERHFEPAEALRKFTDFKGEFSLGDGRIGIDNDGDGRLGEGDSWVDLRRGKPNQNTLGLDAPMIGHELDLTAPELHAGSGGFAAGQTQDGKARAGKVGDIVLQQMLIKVKGLADFTLTLTLEVKDGLIDDVRIGDVTFVDAAELGKLAAPALSDVDPKGVPK